MNKSSGRLLSGQSSDPQCMGPAASPAPSIVLPNAYEFADEWRTHPMVLALFSKRSVDDMFASWDQVEHLMNSCADRALALLRERLEKAEQEVDYFSKQNLEWANCCVELQQSNAGLRKYVHHKEKHNQYFFRCESGWCNPSTDQFGNPAMESLKQLEKRALEAESELTALREQAERLAEALERLSVQTRAFLKLHHGSAEYTQGSALDEAEQALSDYRDSGKAGQ